MMHLQKYRFPYAYGDYLLKLASTINSLAHVSRRMMQLWSSSLECTVASISSTRIYPFEPHP